MARVPIPLLMDEKKRAALEDLRKIEGRPVNQLLNDAIKSFLVHRGARERGLEVNLPRLRAYRKHDPKFRQTMAAFTESEASLDDPLEGEPIEGHL